jgi:hypothetical protein
MMRVFNITDAQDVNHIRREDRLNPEEPNSDISWGQFIAAFLLIPVFVVTGAFLLLADKLRGKSSAGVKP